MQVEVEERMMSTFHVMITRDPDHRHQEGDSDHTAIQDLLQRHHLAEEAHRRGARRDGEGEVQATVLIAATVGAEAGQGVDREVEADMAGGESMKQNRDMTASVPIVRGVSP
jgi:hypothetical protein